MADQGYAPVTLGGAKDKLEIDSIFNKFTDDQKTQLINDAVREARRFLVAADIRDIADSITTDLTAVDTVMLSSTLATTGEYNAFMSTSLVSPMDYVTLNSAGNDFVGLSSVEVLSDLRVATLASGTVDGQIPKWDTDTYVATSLASLAATVGEEVRDAIEVAQLDAGDASNRFATWNSTSEKWEARTRAEHKTDLAITESGVSDGTVDDQFLIWDDGAWVASDLWDFIGTNTDEAKEALGFSIYPADGTTKFLVRNPDTGVASMLPTQQTRVNLGLPFGFGSANSFLLSDGTDSFDLTTLASVSELLEVDDIGGHSYLGVSVGAVDADKSDVEVYISVWDLYNSSYASGRFSMKFFISSAQYGDPATITGTQNFAVTQGNPLTTFTNDGGVYDVVTNASGQFYFTITNSYSDDDTTYYLNVLFNNRLYSDSFSIFTTTAT